MVAPHPHPHQLIGLAAIGTQQTGSGNFPTIGLIDGPVESSHPDLRDAVIRTSGSPSACLSKGSPACVHGTFIAGLLCASPNSKHPGICPESQLVSHSLFCEAGDLRQCPVVTPQHLSDAVDQVIGSGARVVNMSLGLGQAMLGGNDSLHRVFDHAQRKGVLLVGASGNHGRIGHNPLFDHPWVIPVASCSSDGRLDPHSNISRSVGQRGLLAPGENIEGIHAAGGYMKLTGTSAAAAFVTGGIARLWALFPAASAQQIWNAVVRVAGTRKSIVPPLLNLGRSRAALQAQRAQPASSHAITTP